MIGALRLRVVLALAFLPAALLVTSCAHTTPAERQDATVAVKQDEFSNVIQLMGPEAEDSGTRPVLSVHYQLRSGIDKAAPHQVLHQLLATFVYQGETLRFTSVADDAAQPLKFVRIDGTSCGLFDPGCIRREVIGIDISGRMLRERIDAGYRIKIGARSGEAMILTLTPLMISKQLASVDAAMPKSEGNGAAPGVVFTAVEAGGAAAAAGIKPGDMILAVDGHPVTSADELKAILRGATPGQSLMMEIERGGKRLTVDVKF